MKQINKIPIPNMFLILDEIYKNRVTFYNEKFETDLTTTKLCLLVGSSFPNTHKQVKTLEEVGLLKKSKTIYKTNIELTSKGERIGKTVNKLMKQIRKVNKNE